MQSYFTFYSLLALLGCLALGAGYAYFLYSKIPSLSKDQRNILALGRACSIALIAWLIFSPLIKTVSYTIEKPIIVIANDNSQSVAQIKPGNFNVKKYQNDLIRLRDLLSEKFEVRTYNFSDSVKNAFNFDGSGKVTNGVALINTLKDELQNRNVGAVILATDGIFNKGGNPQFDINKLNAPFYTIALGDTTPTKDVLIANINFNELAYVDNDIAIQIQVQAFRANGSVTRLTLKEEGRLVYDQQISLDRSLFVRDVNINLKATTKGIRKLTASVSTITGEITTKNNVQDFFIEVVDGKQEVLIAAAAPHPDIAAIKRALEQNKANKVTIAIAEQLDPLQPANYGSIILYQLPSMQQSASNFINRARGSSASLWYIIGNQTNNVAINNLQSDVRFNTSPNTLQQIFPLPNKDFTTFSLPQNINNIVAEFDPLTAPYGQLTVNVPSIVLFKQQIGKVPTEEPLWFFTNSNGRKTAYLFGEGIWKWRLSEDQENGQPFFDQLVANTLQFLTVKDDKRKFKAFPAKNTFDENERIVLNATLFNDNYEPVNGPDVAVVIKSASGSAFNFNFSRTERAYKLDAGSFPKGRYSFTAETVLGNVRHRSNGAFFVNELISEFQQTTANHQLLGAIAEQTGGKRYRPADLLQIAADLNKSDSLKTLSYEDRRFQDLVNLKWIFFVLLAMLSAEWFFRKRNGVV